MRNSHRSVEDMLKHKPDHGSRKQMDIEEVIANIDRREKNKKKRLENFLASEECSSLCMDDEGDRKQLAALLISADWV